MIQFSNVALECHLDGGAICVYSVQTSEQASEEEMREFCEGCGAIGLDLSIQRISVSSRHSNGKQFVLVAWLKD